MKTAHDYNFTLTLCLFSFLWIASLYMHALVHAARAILYLMPPPNPPPPSLPQLCYLTSFRPLTNSPNREKMERFIGTPVRAPSWIYGQQTVFITQLREAEGSGGGWRQGWRQRGSGSTKQGNRVIQNFICIQNCSNWHEPPLENAH